LAAEQRRERVNIHDPAVGATISTRTSTSLTFKAVRKHKKMRIETTSVTGTVDEELADAIEQIGSLNARNELRGAVPVLNRWHGRSDVRDVLHRLDSRASTA
jgi:hypothetical protein